MFIKRTPVALALASALFSAGAGAAGGSHAQLALSMGRQAVTPADTNSVLAPDGTAGVIIVLKGEPATTTYARALAAAGRGTVGEQAANNAARSTISSLQQQQSTFVSSQLNHIGVSYKELFRTQRVLNAVAVRMRPADMDKVRALPGVDHVALLPVYKRPANLASVPFTNAPAVWNGGNQLGLPFNATGRGIKIGDIDTGLDYIHPDFGGTGALSDYQDVDTTSVIGKNSHNVIFPTNKVIGGYDFAGDAYNPNVGVDPTPDANPMDCGGHGSHTAGTIAGVGVNADGTPYGGIYNPTQPYTANLKIGPGMAPEAKLFALRVFGCGGSTNLVTQAIEWATDPNNNGDLSDHLDVINMSLGSPFGVDIGGNFNSDITAVENAAQVGLISVSAAGNDGDTFFIASAPGAAHSGLMAAASVDPSVPGAVLNETAPQTSSFVATAAGYSNPTGQPVPPAPSGQSGNVVLVNDGSSKPTQACTAFSGANYAGVSGNIALIDRGTCNFTLKVQNAQAAGAIGVIVVDTSTSPLPIAMGGTVSSGADITIPGIAISKPSGAVIKGQLGTGAVAATLTGATAADTLASFSSRGPVTGANGVIQARPDLAAPGLNIPSVQTGIVCNGTTTTGCIVSNPSGFLPGGQVLVLSGTSMATPHVAGMMALLRELNPTASIEELKAMAINGANHDVTLGANATLPYFAGPRIGAGRIDAANSATSKVLAYNADDRGAVSVTFDVEPVGSFSATHNVTLQNRTGTAQTVTLAVDTKLDAAGASFSVPSGTISVPANGTTTFAVTLNADTTQMLRSFDPTQATTGASSIFGGFALPRDYISEESGTIRVLDSNTSSELARVPVYAALRPHSSMSVPTTIGSAAPATGTTNLALTGTDVCTGTLGAGPTCNFTNPAGKDEESFYSVFELQFTGANDTTLPGWANLHYVGVNSAPDATNSTTDVFFGIATYGKWGSPTYASYNICIDSDNDGLFDKVLTNTDLGSLDRAFGLTNEPEDTFISLIYDNVAQQVNFDFQQNLASPTSLDTGNLANNTMILGALASDLGLTGTKFHYGIAVCPGYNPVCGSAGWTGGGQGTNTCGNPNVAFKNFNGPFVYDSSAPGVDGTGQVLMEDLNGGTVAAGYDVNNLVANGSNAMLVLHSHNGVSNSAQVVVLDDIFKDGFGN